MTTSSPFREREHLCGVCCCEIKVHDGSRYQANRAVFDAYKVAPFSGQALPFPQTQPSTTVNTILHPPCSAQQQKLQSTRPVSTLSSPPNIRQSRIKHHGSHVLWHQEPQQEDEGAQGREETTKSRHRSRRPSRCSASPRASSTSNIF